MVDNGKKQGGRTDQGELDWSKEGVIKAWFDYNAETGEFAWKSWVSPDWYKRPASYEKFMHNKAGKPVEFYIHSFGYFYCGIARFTKIYAHHIAWVSTYGEMPKNYIDHIDGDPTNNAIKNLRDVTKTINDRNKGPVTNNTSGFTGVSWHKRAKKWTSTIRVNGESVYLGLFKTAEDAATARKKFIEENSHYGFIDRN